MKGKHLDKTLKNRADLLQKHGDGREVSPSADVLTQGPSETGSCWARQPHVAESSS